MSSSTREPEPRNHQGLPAYFSPEHNHWIDDAYGWSRGTTLQIYQNNEDLIREARRTIKIHARNQRRSRSPARVWWRDDPEMIPERFRRAAAAGREHQRPKKVGNSPTEDRERARELMATLTPGEWMRPRRRVRTTRDPDGDAMDVAPPVPRHREGSVVTEQGVPRSEVTKDSDLSLGTTEGIADRVAKRQRGGTRVTHNIPPS